MPKPLLKRHDAIPFILVWLCWYTPYAVAQSVTCEARTDKQVLTAGEGFTLTVEISGTSLGTVFAPELPVMQGIELIQGIPGETSSIEIINNRRRERRGFQYALRAVKEGHLMIPPIAVNYQGKIYRTKTIAIEVLPPGKQTGGTAVVSDFFLKAVAGKPDPYVGEQITVRFKIYARGNVSNYTPLRNPNFIGFWAEDYPIRQPITPERETVNGKTYNVFTVKHTALFPTYSGALVIDAAEVECEAQVPTERNPFSNFFSPFRDPFGETVVKRLRSEPLIVSVKPLPVKEQPDDFIGLVGRFDGVAQISRKEVKTGELLIYVIDIRGTGNIMNVDIPPSPFDHTFEIYDPKVSFDINRENSVISGSVRIEYPAVPKESGAYTMQPFSFSYFDPVEQKYHTRTSDPITIHIRSAPYSVSSSGKDYSGYFREIRPVKTSPEELVSGSFLVPFWLTAILWLLPPLGYLWIYLSRRRYIRIHTPGSTYRQRTAGARAVKRIHRIAKTSISPKTAASELLAAFTQYLSDKNLIMPSDERTILMADRLRAKGYSPEVVSIAERFISSCNETRFAPEAAQDIPALSAFCLETVKTIEGASPCI